MGLTRPAGTRADLGRLVVVSNRGPRSYRFGAGGQLRAVSGSGGLVSSLRPLLAGTGATWIAAAMSDADRQAAREGLTEGDGITVHLVDCDDATYKMAYDVVANQTLWYLYHGLFDRATRPTFDKHFAEAWEGYRSFNAAFAQVISDQVAEGSIVFVQDYHLALLGSSLAAMRPDLTTLHFSHTPFCNPDGMRVLPDAAARELMEGMGGFHTLGFHSERWADAYRACAEAAGTFPCGAGSDTPGSPGSPPAHSLGDTFVAPLTIDAEYLEETASSPECLAERESIMEMVGDVSILLGVARIEPAKNLVRAVRAYGYLLEAHPEVRERVVFLLLADPSRESLAAYLAYRNELETTVAMVNDRWATPGWTPIILEIENNYIRSLAALSCYDVLFVNSLRDGLNLVAKEGAAINDRDGILVCSREAGVFDELAGPALEAHPYDIVASAERLHEAIAMDRGERATRSKELASRSKSRTTADWLDDVLAQVR